MKKITVSEFAKLHHVNRRTLHYYDEIGLFKPALKGENGYRYYDLSQSIDFIFIRTLKELGMSIEEIKEYYEHPNTEKFLEIADVKIEELDQKIAHLEKLKTSLIKRKEQLNEAEKANPIHIEIQKLDSEPVTIIYLEKHQENTDTLLPELLKEDGAEVLFEGAGRIVSLKSVEKEAYNHVEAIYLLKKGSEIRPAGDYLVGYIKGNWNEIGKLYRKMLKKAEDEHLKLGDTCWEMGLNEFAIESEKDYVTKVMIPILHKG